MKMKSVMGWVTALGLGVVVLLVLAAFFLFGGRYGMMGGYYGMMGPGFGYAYPFGWLGMLLWMVIPIGLFILLLLGGIRLFGGLVNSNHTPAQPSALTPSQNCPNCGKPVQGDWKNCPYCGNSLS
jgi:hypothetical protein